jgi:hypothetical protein
LSRDSGLTLLRVFVPSCEKVISREGTKTQSHPAACKSHPSFKQLAMRASTDKDDQAARPVAVIQIINEQKITADMAFTMARPIAFDCTLIITSRPSPSSRLRVSKDSREDREGSEDREGGSS